jgi:Zn-dependent peptidase ImmA (M78 family)/transcriptional regulator with XRE-family HTH domain
MTGIVNHGLLRVARQRVGFSQGEAAERLGVPQVTLSRYENAATIPGQDFVNRAATVYDLPPSFFLQPDQVVGAPVSVHPMWRKKQDVTATEIGRIVAEINLRVIHMRRMLEAVEFSPQSNIPKLDLDEYEGDVERIASIVRSHWLMPPGPVDNLTGWIERAGAAVIYSPLGGTTVSGVTVSVPGLLPLIILNQYQPSDRSRFTLAHELGHLVMHRFPGPAMEDEANEFASAFLMPKNDVTPVLRGKLDLRRLAALKPEWRVSMQALLYRAQSLGLIEKREATWLWRRMSMGKMRMREPPELDFPVEKAAVIGRMVRLHLDTFGYAKSDFAKLLHIHEKHLPEFYDLTAQPVIPGMRLRLVR